MAEVGVRVVRGPDWQWGDQDGGEGFCGTVVEVGKPGSSSTPDRTVVVHWDMGARTNYRVGYQSAYDLRLLDNAPIGVKHANHICDGCKKTCIYGLMWSCVWCFDYDLCTLCYMADKHDVGHPFRRLDNASCAGIEVPPRKSSTKIPLQGIFVGAKVVRGPDWDWGNQDGGLGEFGRVTEIRGWDGESSRSVASVLWTSSGVSNVYRVGHKGKIDLKCEVPATCGNIYMCHLPVLGRSIPSGSGLVGASVSTASAVPPNAGGDPGSDNRPPFLVGERVKVCVPLQQLRAMQEGHGGWNHKMIDYISQIGVVHRITDKGDVRVQYDGCCTRWTIHPAALARVTPINATNNSGEEVAGAAAAPSSAGVGGGVLHTPLAASTPYHQQFYTPGDRVTVLADEDEVKQYQSGHGEWIDLMKAALGKTGVVAKVYPDGDLRVNVDGKTWTFSPACVTPAPSGSVNFNDRQLPQHLDGNGTTQYQPHHDTHHNHLQHSDIPISNTDINPVVADNRAATEAPVPSVDVSQMPPVINGGSDARLVDKLVREAAHGNLKGITDVLAVKPILIECSSGGKTALQVACHQGHLNVVRCLLERGAHTTTPDRDGDTPLHYAAFGNQVEVLELLIRRGASINALNSGRCTALHVSVNKQHPACVTLLLHYNADANIQDSYGDTALHDAIGKDSVEIVEALTNWPRLDLSRRNHRGFNVLHHAVLKGNNFATEKLVARGRQYVDIRKDDGFAALHLACLNGHREVAETLLSLGRANPNVTNNKRQTPLLLAIAQGHVSLVELLVVHYKAELNCQDEDGETALHLTLHKLNQLKQTAPYEGLGHSLNSNNAQGMASTSDEGQAVGYSDKTPVINSILQNLPAGSSVWLAVACLLVKRGANVTVLNSRAMSPLQSVTDLMVVEALESYTVPSSTAGALSTATRLDLDMKALDLAAEGLRSAVLLDEETGGASMSACPSTSSIPLPHRSTSQPASPAKFVTAGITRPTVSSGATGGITVSASQPASPAHLASPGDGSGNLCMICIEGTVNVRFEPCGHSVTCEECATRVKKCLSCQALVVQKVRHDGRTLTPKSKQPSTDRLRYLESKIADIEEAHSCSICMERCRSVAFMCGHSACVVCAKTLTTCHMCRKPITVKINLY